MGHTVGRIFVQVPLETGEQGSNFLRRSQIRHGIGNGVVVFQSEQRRQLFHRQFVDAFLNELTKSWGGTVKIFGLPLITESSHIGVYTQVVIGLMLVFLMVFRPQGMFGNRKEMAIDGH